MNFEALNPQLVEHANAKIRRHCDIKRGRHVALAFSRSGHLITSATNKRAEVGQISSWSIHGEEHLIRKLRKIKAAERYGDIDILVIRMHHLRGPANSKPCPGCERMMLAYGIRRVFYTDDFGRVVLL